MSSVISLAARRTRSRPSSDSRVRALLVGARQTSWLSHDAQALVECAEALDALLTARGWELDLAGAGALSWHWPPSGSATDALYACAAGDAHELEPATSISLFFERLRITDPHVVRAGDCTHTPDTQVPLGYLLEMLGTLEDHRHVPCGDHVC